MQERWLSRMRSRKVAISGTMLVVVVIIALGVGLGVGLTRQQSRHALPVVSFDDSQQGMLRSSIYFSRLADEDYQLHWKEVNFSLQDGLSNLPSNMSAIKLYTNETAAPWMGVGGELTDSSALLLSQLKTKSERDYNVTLDYLFNRRSGLSIVRVAIGSTDYPGEAPLYTLADIEGIQSSPNGVVGALSNFSMAGPERHLIPVLRDALQRNPDLKIALTSWTAPAWMKQDSNVGLFGGEFNSTMTPFLAEYLTRAVLGFKDELGVTPWSLSVQNNADWATDAYPSMLMSTADISDTMVILREKLAAEGLSTIQLFGPEENLSRSAKAADLLTANASAVDAVAWHCFHGNGYTGFTLTDYYSRLMTANIANKTFHMTECAEKTSLSPYPELQRYAPSLTDITFIEVYDLISSLGLASITLRSIALDSDHGPHVASPNCTNCAGLVTIEGSSVTASLQGVLATQFAAASADLSRFGGSPPRTLRTGSHSSTGCAGRTFAFQADWNSTLSRYGLFLEWLCDDKESYPLPVEIYNSDGTARGHILVGSLQKGFSTVVFSERR